MDQEFEDLQTNVSTLTDDVEELQRLPNDVDDIRDDLTKLTEHVHGTKLPYTSHAQYTIQLCTRNATQELNVNDTSSWSVIGHGCLLIFYTKHKVNTRKVNTRKGFLCTAAHVIVELGCQMKLKRKLLVLNSENQIVADPPNNVSLYVTPSYISTGLQDVGMIPLSEDWRVSPDRITRCGYNRNEFVDPVVGTELIGQSHVHIRGRVVATQDDRVLLQACSLPGCSGTPMFTADGLFAAVLHGLTPHRTPKLHVGADTIKIDFDDVTDRVYVDSAAGCLSESMVCINEWVDFMSICEYDEHFEDMGKKSFAEACENSEGLTVGQLKTHLSESNSVLQGSKTSGHRKNDLCLCLECSKHSFKDYLANVVTQAGKLKLPPITKANDPAKVKVTPRAIVTKLHPFACG